MAKHRRYFEFGEFSLDVGERALRRSGESLPLTPKAFDTLAVLVENAGNLVEKDEIMKAVWPDSFVEEAGLARNISVLRKALGQDAGGQQFIETVAKKGYRFTADVREHVEQGAALVSAVGSSQAVQLRDTNTAVLELSRVEPPQDSLELSVAKASRRSRSQVAIASVVVALALGSLLWYAFRSRPFDKGNIKSIAVLPFKRLDKADDAERFGIGMADTLITRLSNIQALTVRSTRDVMRYEEGAQDLAAAGNALDVDAVLDGSFQQAADRVRITVRLIHTRSKSQIWAAQFDEKLSDIFTMQDAISAQVVESLSLNLSDVERQQLAKKYTEDLDAYQAYLKGRYFLTKRTREDVGKTIEHFEEAIRLSPNYALAYAGLADTYATKAYLSRTTVNRELSYSQAKQAALKAIEIDDRLAEAHASLGFILRDSEWNWMQSEKSLKRAIELNPNYASAHHYYAVLLATLGRVDEAVSEIATAQRLDPLSLLINADMAEMYIFAREPQRAIEVAQKALEMDPRYMRLQRMLMWAYLQAGRFDEAIREVQNAPESEGPSAIFSMSIRGCALAASGQREKADEMAGKLLALADTYAPAFVQAAAICSMLGEKDRAFELLEKAFAARDDRFLWIKVDPRFDGLRNDLRYAQLLERTNLPQ